MQGRAELGAVVGVDASLADLDGGRGGLARLHRQVDVVLGHGEAVGLVLSAFQVGEVDGDFITLGGLDDLGRDMRADQGAEHLDLTRLLVGMLRTRTHGERGLLLGPGIGAERIADIGVQLAHLDGHRVVGLAQGQRHIVEQLHLVAADIDQLVILRMQRTHGGEAVDGQLVQGDQILALGLGGIAFHGHQMADVVMDGNLVQHLAFTVIPLGDHGVHIEGGIGDAGLGIVLGVQRTKTQGGLVVGCGFQGDDRNAVFVLAREILGGQGCLDLGDVIDGGMAVQLARDDDHLAIGSHVGAMGALGLGDEHQDAFLDGDVHGQDIMAVDLLGLSGLDQFGGLLPVDHMQEVAVLGGAAGFEGRAAALDATHVTLGAERVHEGPAIGRPLTEIGQILAIGRQFEGEGVLGLDPALVAVELPEGDAAAILLVELLQRSELAAQRGRILRRFGDVIGVRADESAAMLGGEDRVLDDLLGLEVAQVDHRDAGRILVIDEQPLTIGLAIGLGQGRVMGIAPQHGFRLALDHGAFLQDALGLVVEAVTLPGLGSEDADILQDAHGRNAVDDHLTALTTRAEHHELVDLAGRIVGLGGGHDVVFGQSTTLHDILERFSRGSACHQGAKAHRGEQSRQLAGLRHIPHLLYC